MLPMRYGRSVSVSHPNADKNPISVRDLQSHFDSVLILLGH